MTKYINAERLKDSMFAYYDCLEESANGRPYKGDTLMDYEVVDMIEDCIDSAPPADVVEVKHGEHIQKGAWHIECSVCRHILAHIGEAKNYCPNCGAKMDGRSDGDE